MASRKNADLTFRTNIARYLDSFAEILSRENVVQDVSPIHKASYECRNYRHAGKWGYSIENLTFRRLGVFKTFQSKCENLVLQFSVIVEGSCEEIENIDPLTHLAFRIYIEGEYLGIEDKGKAYSVWHLDRHEAEMLEFVHPVYHLSFGGMLLENLLDRRNTPILLADTPRLAHPPLDAFLGVDLIITNFLGKSLCKFRDNGEYIKIISFWQKKLWRPYANSVYGHWQPNNHALVWQPSLIWPQLMAVS